MKNKWLKYGMMLMVGILVMICLSVVCYKADSLPTDILEGEWKWMYLCYAVSFIGFAVLVIFGHGCLKEYLPVAVSGAFILFGAIEAVWGIRQVYGFTYSNHSLYALTGSFYNPGPYSGYLAMVFPICLHEWLKRKDNKKASPYYNYIILAVMLLILCVLPAGMSRSAWIATAVSSAYIAGMHNREKVKSFLKRYGLPALVITMMALAGIYQLKKDSADGRLFMWKIATHAVGERPWTGYGWNSVPAAYGQAQEEYFAAGHYTPTEERVAGAPEYVFNEYLQVAIAWGIPALCMGMLVIVGSMYAGHKKGELGLCGALMSLAIFSFSSYPLQFPAFISALVMLVSACGIGIFSFKKWWGRLVLAALLVVGSCLCLYGYQQKDVTLKACRQWSKSRMFYQSGAYRQAIESAAEICEDMKWNARFLFEYGHALHKSHQPQESNGILKEALKVSGDPMILNIIGKNEQEMKNYENAEHWYLRAVHRLPGRIYPYYLLARLYADSAFYHRDKLQHMGKIVMEKEPKVQSTAIKQMRREVKELLQKAED